MFSLTAVPELLGALSAAEKLLTATGNAVTLCPNYGIGKTGGPEPSELREHGQDGLSELRRGNES